MDENTSASRPPILRLSAPPAAPSHPRSCETLREADLFLNVGSTPIAQDVIGRLDLERMSSYPSYSALHKKLQVMETIPACLACLFLARMGRDGRLRSSVEDMTRVRGHGRA